MLIRGFHGRQRIGTGLDNGEVKLREESKYEAV